MAQSPEYPDLRWMPPRSWTNANRTAVQLIVIHTTEGSAHGQSAEDGAAYNQRRTDGTSAHYFVDDTSVVHCVRTNDQAHTARSQGNRRGIQYELCGRAYSQNWESGYSRAMLARAAKQAARDAKKWGIPVRHLSVAQVAAGAKGFCGHVDITRAFPQDRGTHTDPGPNFPWSRFLDMVRAELAPAAPKEWDEMATEQQVKAAAKAAVFEVLADGYAAATGKASGDSIEDRQKRNVRDFLRAIVGGPTGDVDEQQIAASVLAGLDPALIAAAIPADLAQRVADELAARLQG